jgi:four helix bundle protein
MAEGVAKRGTTGEFRRFLDIALGSLSEISYLVRLAADLGFMTPAQRDQLEEVRTRAAQLTWGLYRAQGGRRVDRGTVGRSHKPASPLDPRA